MWNSHFKLIIEKMNIQNVKITLPSIVLMAGMVLGVPIAFTYQTTFRDIYDKHILLPRHEKLMKQVNDKKFLSLDSKFQEKFRRLGIMEGDVTFEKCKKAMDHVDPKDFD